MINFIRNIFKAHNQSFEIEQKINVLSMRNIELVEENERLSRNLFDINDTLRKKLKYIDILIFENNFLLDKLKSKKNARRNTKKRSRKVI